MIKRNGDEVNGRDSQVPDEESAKGIFGLILVYSFTWLLVHLYYSHT
jgi:hypothetical protein